MKDTNPGNLDKKDSRNRHNDENQTVRLPQMTLNQSELVSGFVQETNKNIMEYSDFVDFTPEITSQNTLTLNNTSGHNS